MDFRLRNVPLLSRVGADRADELRTDVDAAVDGWSDAQLLRVDDRGQVLVAGGRLVLTPAADYAARPPMDAVFLGRIEGGRHVWAVRAPLVDADEPQKPQEIEEPAEIEETEEADGAEDEPAAEVRAVDPRRTDVAFDDVSAQLVACALALLNWHDTARFSPSDGNPTRSIRAGWARRNLISGNEEFPRVDPAIICLVHDGHDRAVLARQVVWPPRLFSLIAGFVEAGESFESCVVREVAEETGLTVTDVTYLGSQPWPFPRSLMIGFHALGDPEQEFVYSDGELAEAAWFTRDEVRAALDAGDWTSDSTSRLLLPGSISIAREIIESWAYAD